MRNDGGKKNKQNEKIWMCGKTQTERKKNLNTQIKKKEKKKK